MPIPESLSSESESTTKSLFKFSRLFMSGVKLASVASDNSVFSEFAAEVVEVPESIELFFRLRISGEFKKLLTGLKDL